MPDEQKLETGIAVLREGIAFSPGDGDVYTVTMKECCEQAAKSGDNTPLILFGCFMSLATIAEASRDTANAIKAATALGEKAADGQSGAVNEALDRVLSAFDQMPNKPDGMTNIMNMLRTVGGPKK